MNGKFLAALLVLVMAVIYIAGVSATQTITLADSLAADPSYGHGLGKCHCESTNCSCCADVHFSLKKHDFNETVCVDIGYIPSQLAVFVELLLNGKVIWQDTKSAENPDFCVAIPISVFELLGVDVCADFMNLDFDHKHLSGCLDLEVKWRFGTVVKPFQVDCFNLTV